MTAPVGPTAVGGTRELLVATAVVLAIMSSIAGAGLGAGLRDNPPTASRAATDRSCGDDMSDPPARLPGPRLARRLVGEVADATAVAFSPDDSGDGVLATRTGRLLRITRGQITPEVLLDLETDTTDDGDGGLTGVLYDPSAPWLYLYRTTRDFEDLVTAYRLDRLGRPQVATARTILTGGHPYNRQHHGGSMVFGADGMLYVGFGDGGGLGDPGENAQNPSTLLGKIVRVAPTPDRRAPYRVPQDNPFVDMHGWAPEIWLLGVRNPFRMSADDESAAIWLGDVGQSCWEEIDRLPASSSGANLGWDRREGFEPFEGGDVKGRLVEPVHAYSHANGRCAVVLGHVVRAQALPVLAGWLLFTDYCQGRLLALHADSTAASAEVVDLGIVVDQPTAIVRGPAGLPWVLTLAGEIYELAPS